MNNCENLQMESEIFSKLLEAETESKLTDTRYSSKDVFTAMRNIVEGKEIV